MMNLICIFGGEMNEEHENYLKYYDTEDCAVHIFTNVLSQEILPQNILAVLDELSKTQQEEAFYVFFSDCKELTELIYRIYHQIFEGFIFYLGSGKIHNYKPQGIYMELMKRDMVEEENLYKTLYIIGDKTFNTQEWKINKEKIKYCSTDTKLSFGLIKQDFIQKYYRIDGWYYLFEPVEGKKRLVFAKNSEHIRIPQSRILYQYCDVKYLLERLKQYLDIHVFAKKYSELREYFSQLEEQQTGSFEKQLIACVIEDCCLSSGKGTEMFQIFCYSFLLWYLPKPAYGERIAEIMMENEDLFRANNQFFMWMQLKRIQLLKSNVSGTSGYMKKLYDSAYRGYENELKTYLTPIPKTERNPNRILVLTIQFLRERHAPTRTTLERCYTIGKSMGRELRVINTREQMSMYGGIPIYQPYYRNVLKEYNKLSEFTYKNYTFSFYQPSVEMPQRDEMIKIIEEIREWKPYMIICIGGGSIIGDLCSYIVPTLTIPVTFSTIAARRNQFVVVGRAIRKDEWKELEKEGYSKENVIESTFTFDLNPQKTTLTRQILHLPEDKFLLVVVGIRLDYEIDDTFIKAMAQTFPFSTHLVFAGYFERYAEFCEKYPELRQNSTFLGYQNDILALMEICDICINPYRVGGGFSIAEAFYKGKPGITVDYGDVAAAAGKEFCVSSYKEMVKEIIHYIQEPDYYKQKSILAKKRAEEITDSVKAMQNILIEAEQREGFF